MTGSNPSRPPDGTAGSGQQARQQASRVGQHASQAGGQVAHTVAEQGGHVADEVRSQARNLTGEATGQLREQAGAQQRRAADGLRTLGRELGSMADQSQDSGLAAQAVRRAADAAQQAAGWLDDREPGAVVGEMREYARRHPGTFLAGAAVAGLLVGRLTRSLTSLGDGARGETGGPPPTSAAPQPYERTVEAPYEVQEPYVGSARVRAASPPGARESDIPGGVAP